MSDKQPEALLIADQCDESAKLWANEVGTRRQAAALLRTQHAEIQRLTSCLKWEQNRADRIGTHGPGCEKWGPAHYECALRAIERKDALLRQALAALDAAASWVLDKEILTSIHKELSQ